MAKTITCVVLLAVIAVFYLFYYQINRLAVFDREGVIWSGEVLGVYIGQSTTRAGAILVSSGWKQTTLTRGGNCVHHHYDPQFEVRGFNDFSWRDGTVCVVSKNERVVALEWFFRPLNPEL